MNKHLHKVLKATVILLMFFSNDNTAQVVVLVNGVPTKVVLDGEVINNIVQQQVADYMEEFGQEPDDSFTKSVINFTPVKEKEKLKNKEVSKKKDPKEKIKSKPLPDKVQYVALKDN